MSNPIGVVNRYYRAINEQRWDLYVELFHADAALEAPGGYAATGPDATRAFDQVWANAAPDFTVTPLIQVADGTTVVSENRVSGTQTGALVTPAGEIPASGAHFEDKYVGVFEVVDGRIASQHIYYDRLKVVETLGMPVTPVGAA